jgi:hypothetical protein
MDRAGRSECGNPPRGAHLPSTITTRFDAPVDMGVIRADGHHSGQAQGITTLDPTGEEFRPERGTQV